MNNTIPQLVTDGFAFAFLVWLTVWGLTIPFRWLVRALGLGDTTP